MSWQSYPSELLNLIFDYLGFGDLVRVSQTCQQWRIISFSHIHSISNIDEIFERSQQDSLSYSYFLAYYGKHYTLDQQLMVACRLNMQALVAYLLDNIGYAGSWKKWIIKPKMKLSCCYSAGLCGSIGLYRYLERRCDLDYSKYFNGACQGGHRDLAILLLLKVPSYNKGVVLAIIHEHGKLAYELLKIIRVKHKQCEHYAILLAWVFQSIGYFSDDDIINILQEDDSYWFTKITPIMKQNCLMTMLRVKGFDELFLNVFLKYYNNLDTVLLLAAQAANLPAFIYILRKMENEINKRLVVDYALVSGSIEMVKYVYQWANILPPEINSAWVISPEIYNYLKPLVSYNLGQKCLQYMMIKIDVKQVALLYELIAEFSSLAGRFLWIILLHSANRCQEKILLQTVEYLLQYINEGMEILYALQIVISNYQQPRDMPLFSLLYSKFTSKFTINALIFYDLVKLVIDHEHLALLNKLPIHMLTDNQLRYLQDKFANKYIIKYLP